MRKCYLFFIIVSLFNSCVNNDTPTSQSFQNVDGFLYFEPPETGSIVSIVFLPIKKDIKPDLNKLDISNYKKGIKFITANSIIIAKLYERSEYKAILKGGVNRAVYIIPNTRIHFHVDTLAFSDDSTLIKDLKSDTLIYKGKTVPIKYFFNFIELDSIDYTQKKHF